MLDLTPGAFLLLAASVLLVPIPWLVSWLGAAIVHELGHYIMVRLVGGEVHKLRIGGAGARMQAIIESDWKKILCAVSGPAGGLLLLLTARWTPRLAVCSLIQSAYNLIPIYPLDGGRIAAGILKWIFPKSYKGITAGVDAANVCALALLCLYFTISRNMGILPIILLISILSQKRMIKIPCKARRMRVQ